MKSSAKLVQSSSDTRDRLLAAAIEAFGRKGFDGASIREIAASAGVNLAGIAYHFGGKDQLYRASLSHIVHTIAENVESRIADRFDAPPRTSEAARAALKKILAVMAEAVLATPRFAGFSRMIVREQMDPSPAFDVLYEGFMAPMHRRLCDLWALATGEDPQSDHVKLAVFSAVGQILVFRIARAGALKRLAWNDIGPEELSAIVAHIKETIDLLATRRGKGGFG